MDSDIKLQDGGLLTIEGDVSSHADAVTFWSQCNALAEAEIKKPAKPASKSQKFQ